MSARGLALALLIGCAETTSTTADASHAAHADALPAADALAPDAHVAPDSAATNEDATTSADAAAVDASAIADAGSSTTTRRLSPNEVSILLPLDPAGLLRADAMGGHGALVPATLAARAAPLLLGGAPEDIYERLRVVGVRLDPCAKISPRAPCHGEIRLVLQPVPAASMSEDAALHAIYRLPIDELAGLVAELRALGDREPSLHAARSLRVHPVIAAEGLGGPYARALHAAMLARIGEARLERLTFMQLSGRANIWVFGGFDRGPRGFETTPIPGVQTETQRVVHNVFSDELRIGVQPSVVDGDDLTLLYDSSAIAAATPADRLVALGAALRVENPERHSAATVDCARCHVAGIVRRFVERHHGVDLSSHPDLYRSTAMDLAVPETIPPPQAQRNFRAFGWHGAEPAISPRVAHETAEVLEILDP